MKKNIIILFIVLFSNCSDMGDLKDREKNSDTQQSEQQQNDNNLSIEDNHNQQTEENKTKPISQQPQQNSDNQPIQKEKPYINPFQPDTTLDPNIPKYIPPKINKEYINGIEVKTLLNKIETDTQLSNRYLWKIDGQVEIASGVKLKIEAGTIIFAKSSTSSIIFKSQSSLIAIGTKYQPIIFTTQEDLEKNSSRAGQWKGIELQSTSNSVLKYIQIRYSGNGQPSLKLKNERYSTVLEFIEIYLSAYDGLQISGGDVNIRNSAFIGVAGDSISLQGKWRGKMQNIYIEQSDNRFKDKSSGIDIFNIEEGIFANITIKSLTRDVGAGIYIRNGLNIELYNSIVTGERKASCIESNSNINNNNYKLESNVIGGCVGGSHKNINLDSSLNYISINNIDWNKAEKTIPINLYSIDDWFDEYRQNYIGAYNQSNPKPWWKYWTIGVEK